MRAVFTATSIAIVLGAAWACLPDLEIASTNGPPAGFCGDGFIDPDAGEQCDPGPSAPLPDGGDAGPLASACIDCKVVCSGSTVFEDPATQHCYLRAGQTAASTTATSDCEGWGGHLVRFVSEAELSLVASNADSEPYWIGLGRELTGVWLPLETTYEPGWTSVEGCLGCFAQIGDSGTISPDPTEAVPDGKCVIGYTTLAQPWTESQCSALSAGFSRQTICEREPVGSRARACGANVCLTVAATESAKRYVVLASDGGLAANDAVLACAAQGGRLAVLGSREEREQLGREIGDTFGPATAWIGLSDTDGNWGWDAPDAGGMTPPPWGEGEPALIAGSVGRAFVRIDSTQLDSELAHAASASDAGGESHPALCEIP